MLESNLNRRDHVRELPVSLLKIVNFVSAPDRITTDLLRL